ncbi:PstS family phosphate ABC transporter substrate-binding protein [Paenibacillus wulumuqiensis]|uniref:PstS family phosphate ABC transporter substrate-binding protein n=1 Tax=Paenibacillus wulumuqiensis TaxID=1567107 RepID=UPI0006190F21|nr:PstS family phosphate ABC transporter substrate-binding protein [Paenibacillus wulumuqiensis]
MERIMITIGVALMGLVGCVFAGLAGMIMIGFLSDHPVFYTAIWFIVLLILETGLILTRFDSIRHHPWYKRLLIGCLSACVLTAAGYKGYTMYDRSLVAVSVQDVDLQQYEPFHPGSQIAVLDKTPSYHLNTGDKLPRLDGATALYPVYSAFVQAVYPKDGASYGLFADDSIVRGNGTGPAYERLIGDNADMIFAAAPSSGQKQLARKHGVELHLTPIGKEGFVFFVNKNNPVTNLTSQQIKQIYTGKITNWKQVGGSNEPIRAFQRPEDSGSQAMLRKWMGSEQPMTPPIDRIASGMGGIMEEVADYRNYSNAIGYSFHFFATTMNPNPHIRLLSVDGVYPNDEHISSGAYKLTVPFYAVTAGKTSKHPNTESLLQWILSPEGQQLIRQTGYIPLPVN